MTVNSKRVFYVKYLAHEIYTEILKARPDVRLDNQVPAEADVVPAVCPGKVVAELVGDLLGGLRARLAGAERDRRQNDGGNADDRYS